MMIKASKKNQPHRIKTIANLHYLHGTHLATKSFNSDLFTVVEPLAYRSKRIIPRYASIIIFTKRSIQGKVTVAHPRPAFSIPPLDLARCESIDALSVPIFLFIFQNISYVQLNLFAAVAP